MLVEFDPIEESLQEVGLPLHPLRQDERRHVLPDLGAPGDHLPHRQPHHRHDPRQEVDKPAVIDLPEDFVEPLDVVVVLRVAVGAPRGITEVVVEDIAARLKFI